MAKIQKDYDTHPELIVQRWGNGVKLMKMDEGLEIEPNSSAILGNLFSLPLNVYFIDCDSVIKNMNERTAESCGFTSVNSALNNTVAIAASKEAANFEFQHDQMVCKTQSIIIRDEIYTRLIDDLEFTGINFKLPWYNKLNKLIGIFGFCVIVSANEELQSKTGVVCSVADALTNIIPLGLFNTSSNANFIPQILPGEKICNSYLTKRQAQIVRLMFQGKSNKEIARILNLSPRTIESYIDNAKQKLNVTRKSELMWKIQTYLNNPVKTV